MQALLCVTQERELTSQLGSIFPEFTLDVYANSTVLELLTESNADRWRAIVLDLDALDGESMGILGVAKRFANFGAPVIAIVSVRLLPLMSELRKYGMYVLHKPASAGEVGLAVSRALKNI